MARVRLDIDDLPNQYAMKAMLQAEGHEIVGLGSDPQVVVADDPERAASVCREWPTLVLASMADAGEAVKAMRRGVLGYILLPFQPGEAPLMVERALLMANNLTAQRVTNDDEEIVPLTLEEVEEVHILDTLRRCRNNQARAARELGIGRNTLWRKLKRIRGKMANSKKRPELDT